MAERDTDIYSALAAYEDAKAAYGSVDLPAFVEARPECRDEIIDYASYQFVFENGAVYNAELLAPKAEERLLARAAAIRAKRERNAPAIASLVEAAKNRGLTVPALAQMLRLSPLEVSKLNQRLFRPDSVPASLVRRLAETLDQTFEAVSGYLRLPPTLSAQASYRAEAAPRVAEQSDFADAIDSSRPLAPEDRAYWQKEMRDEG
jgi:hypothetical protein